MPKMAAIYIIACMLISMYAGYTAYVNGDINGGHMAAASAMAMMAIVLMFARLTVK